MAFPIVSFHIFRSCSLLPSSCSFIAFDFHITTLISSLYPIIYITFYSPLLQNLIHSTSHHCNGIVAPFNDEQYSKPVLQLVTRLLVDAFLLSRGISEKNSRNISISRWYSKPYCQLVGTGCLFKTHNFQ